MEYMESSMQNLIEGGISEMDRQAAEKDLLIYGKALRNGWIGTCLAIEEHYGLVGATPEMVSCELAKIAGLE